MLTRGKPATLPSEPRIGFRLRAPVALWGRLAICGRVALGLLAFGLLASRLLAFGLCTKDTHPPVVRVLPPPGSTMLAS
jgi:hypothetical protein